MLRKIFLFWGMVFLLGACTSFEKPQQNSLWQPQRDWAMFEAEGRMSVRVGERGYPVGFVWLRQYGVEMLDMRSPLGTTVMQLCQDGEGVMAVDQRGKRYQGKTAEELSGWLLGVKLPVQYLLTWVNGEWVRDVPYQINHDGGLVQAGWTVMREVNEQGKVRVLMVRNDQFVLRMVFAQVERQQGLPEKQESCTMYLG